MIRKNDPFSIDVKRGDKQSDDRVSMWWIEWACITAKGRRCFHQWKRGILLRKCFHWSQSGSDDDDVAVMIRISLGIEDMKPSEEVVKLAKEALKPWSQVNKPLDCLSIESMKPSEEALNPWSQVKNPWSHEAKWRSFESMKPSKESLKPWSQEKKPWEANMQYSSHEDKSMSKQIEEAHEAVMMCPLE
jgi:hypothetical protein